MRHRFLLPLIATVPLSSCFLSRDIVNEPLQAGRFAALQPGVSTAAEVVDALGAPTDVVQLGRRSAYRYDFQASKRAGLLLVVVALFNEDTRTDRAWLFFDENQVLSHVGVTLNAENVEWAMPWQSVHD